MTEYEPSTYGDRIAEVYDDLYDWMLDTEAAVEGLARLAGDGPVLELGIGTGRLAVPLAQREIQIHGIDSSEAMVARMREKSGGEGIPVSIGSFLDPDPPGGPYAMVFVAFNTLFALESQDEQVACFRAIVEHLAPGGIFVVDAFVPDPRLFSQGQRVEARKVETDRVLLSASLHDPVGQRVLGSQILLEDGRVKLYPVNIRYAYPAELDLMARLAGLRLRSRHGGWNEEPLTASSPRHVSVYERA